MRGLALALALAMPAALPGCTDGGETPVTQAAGTGAAAGETEAAAPAEPAEPPPMPVPLPFQPEAQQRLSIGADLYGREQFLEPGAAQAWQRLSAAARADGIELQVVSAFRSVAYQADLVARKLDAGQTLPEVYKVSAPPGYSEHHTGRALDLATPGYPVLEEEFELSPAFRWLQQHAPAHGFHLSYPRGNEYQIDYEPWHWCYRGADDKLPSTR